MYQVGLQIAFCEVSEGIEIVFRHLPGFASDDFFFRLDVCCTGALVTFNF